MDSNAPAPGRAELRAACRDSRGLFWSVGVFSVFGNLLMLTGPLYMLQIYDRVLGSGSVETLVALSLLVLFLYTVMGLLDHARGRIMGRAAARFQERLDQRVFEAQVTGNAAGGLRDLDAVRRLMASPTLTAVFDIPLTPLFIFGIWVFHPWLGIMALSGGAMLIGLTALAQWIARGPWRRAVRTAGEARHMAGQFQRETEALQAFGMTQAAFDRWRGPREAALRAQIRTADIAGAFGTSIKVVRLFLQSLMLGLGAYLVLQGALTPGAMIAASILMGRALAPIEQAIALWPAVQRAAQGWQALAALLQAVPPRGARMALPRPRALLQVKDLSVIPPGAQQPALRQVSFTIQPGQAVGIIGPSGSGKSSLAQCLAGVWPLAAGAVRLDGATLAQYGPAGLSQHIGYLPQRVALFDGTVGENIARLSPGPDPAAVVDAAMRAGAHDMVLRLPQGYDTHVTAEGEGLSGGQRQQIGLSRALYGDPVLLILDEPNAHLDHAGCAALTTAIRAFRDDGKAVLVMAHRPAAIEACNMLLTLDGGALRGFGPKQQVLHEVVGNHAEITRAAGGAP
jgi:ATP-binding cassette subfamily C protein